MDRIGNLDKVTELQNLAHENSPDVNELKTSYEYLASTNYNQFSTIIHAVKVVKKIMNSTKAVTIHRQLMRLQ